MWYRYPKQKEAVTDPSQFPIQEMPNTVLSPHLGGFTRQSARQNIQQTIENIRSYIQTGKAKFEVDFELMY